VNSILRMLPVHIMKDAHSTDQARLDATHTTPQGQWHQWMHLTMKHSQMMICGVSQILYHCSTVEVSCYMASLVCPCRAQVVYCRLWHPPPALLLWYFPCSLAILLYCVAFTALRTAHCSGPAHMRLATALRRMQNLERWEPRRVMTSPGRKRRPCMNR
jgi:hypothetical protein